jgi:hypothetical protein
MSIDPTMVYVLYEKYGVNARAADFTNTYENLPPTSTIGSYAFIIASKDVSNASILRMLETLDSSKPLIKKLSGQQNLKYFQLDEFDFLESFYAEHNKNLIQNLRDLLFFIVSIIITTSVVLTILLWFISSHIQNKHFGEISEAAIMAIPNNTSLGCIVDKDRNKIKSGQIEASEWEAGLPIPLDTQNLKEVITGLVEGICKLYLIRRNINEDYLKGGITDSHHLHLLDHQSMINLKLKNIFAQQLNAYFRQNKPILKEELRSYYTGGYLSKDDYCALRDRHYQK